MKNQIYNIGIIKCSCPDNKKIIYYQMIGFMKTKKFKPFLDIHEHIFKTYKEAKETLEIFVYVMISIGLKVDIKKFKDISK